MPRPNALLFGLAASIALISGPGCGSKPPEVDTAEVTPPPSKAPAEPARAEPPAGEPVKDAPKE